MTARERREAMEDRFLSKYACRSSESRGRMTPVKPCELRTCFQRDIDRIVHSKSFRRLKHKTQVFLQPEGDHYRTRMTHTLEVARIARTIARALDLNEDLAEAVAFGHDLGHTPFGHAGEKALNEVCPGGFRHNEQSLRIVDLLENDGKGLNLTYEVRMGILAHSGDKKPETLEAWAVRLADKIAYINHDIDDAIRAGVLKNEDIPRDIAEILGDTHGQRIDSLTRDIVENSIGSPELRMTPEVERAMRDLREFMFERVYRNPKAKGEERKTPKILLELFEYYVKNPDKLPSARPQDEIGRRAVDYIAGMTDKFAVDTFNEIFIPTGWQRR
ncbi:MAG: deoxyguanosinetriphosphate triphosphohydrolase [Oscillospiraceae bacterium]|jgi:dGTPase